MPTAWSNSGSLVSDRIRPNPPKQQQQNKAKGKGKAPTPGPPRSKAVRVLEARLDGARGSNGRAKDPEGGCFCQAREHLVSSYVPMCRQCGLILCALNPAHCACPHCASPLMNERERLAMVERLEGALTEQLAREEMERERTIEEARAAEGAFPTLPGSQAQLTRTTHMPSPTTRTVLSLNSETKRVTVSSYSTPIQSRPASRREDREDGEEEERRVPGPPREVNFVTNRQDPGRPWRNVRIEDAKYVPLLPAGTTNDMSERSRRKKGGEHGIATARTGSH